MKPKMFEELLEGVREGGAILRGQRKPSRRCLALSLTEQQRLAYPLLTIDQKHTPAPLLGAAQQAIYQPPLRITAPHHHHLRGTASARHVSDARAPRQRHRSHRFSRGPSRLAGTPGRIDIRAAPFDTSPSRCAQDSCSLGGDTARRPGELSSLSWPLTLMISTGFDVRSSHGLACDETASGPPHVKTGLANHLGENEAE